MIGVGEAGDDQRELPGQPHDAVAVLEVERVERQHQRADVAEARGQHPLAAPEGLLEPGGRLRRDEAAIRHREHGHGERIGQLRRPRDLDVGAAAELRAGLAHERHEGRGLGQRRGRGARAHQHPVAAAEREPAAVRDREAPRLDVGDQAGIGPPGRRALDELGRPHEEEVLPDVAGAAMRRRRQAPRDGDRHLTELAPDAGGHEQGPDGEVGMGPGGEEHLRDDSHRRREGDDDGADQDGDEPTHPCTPSTHRAPAAGGNPPIPRRRDASPVGKNFPTGGRGGRARARRWRSGSRTCSCATSACPGGTATS